MKIAYFSYVWDLWGASVGPTIKALELMGALSKLGHEIKIYWRRDDINRIDGNHSNKRSMREFFKKYFSRYLHEPNQLLRNIPSIKEEIGILRHENPNLVISRLEIYSYSPVKLTRKTNIPFLIEVDCPASYEKIVFQSRYRSTQWLLYWMEKQSIISAKAAFAQSNQVKEYYVKRGIPEEKFTVIRNGVNPDKFSPTVDSSVVKNKYQLYNTTVIGFVGSFSYWHGVENLAAIIENIINKHKNIKFLMVGEGGRMKQYLQKFTKDRKIEEQVILTGFVSYDEIPKYISAMDIVLAPYPRLDFFYYSPLKIYEYMSCGKAIITTKVGQIAEVIKNQRNGFLTEANDLKTMTSIISKLIENPEIRERVGHEARKDVLEKHTWEKRGEQLSELCLQCVD